MIIGGIAGGAEGGPLWPAAWAGANSSHSSSTQSASIGFLLEAGSKYRQCLGIYKVRLADADPFNPLFCGLGPVKHAVCRNRLGSACMPHYSRTIPTRH